MGGGGTLISRPDLWPENTELDFGDGLYGQRFTGKITQAANSKAQIMFIYSIGKLISYGGEWQWGSSTVERATIPDFFINGSGIFTTGGFLFKTGTGGLRFDSYSSGDRTNAPYDVWVLYTKA